MKKYILLFIILLFPKISYSDRDYISELQKHLEIIATADSVQYYTAHNFIGDFYLSRDTVGFINKLIEHKSIFIRTWSSKRNCYPLSVPSNPD